MNETPTQQQFETIAEHDQAIFKRHKEGISQRKLGKESGPSRPGIKHILDN